MLYTIERDCAAIASNKSYNLPQFSGSKHQTRRKLFRMLLDLVKKKSVFITYDILCGPFCNIFLHSVIFNFVLNAAPHRLGLHRTLGFECRARETKCLQLV